MQLWNLTEMNSAERVMATLQGAPVDRRAVVTTTSLYGARLTGCVFERYYTVSKEYADGQAAIIERFQPDLLLSPLCVANEAKAFGCDKRYMKENPPNITKRAIACGAEIDAIKFPDIDTHPSILYTRELPVNIEIEEVAARHPLRVDAPRTGDIL